MKRQFFQSGFCRKVWAAAILTLMLTVISAAALAAGQFAVVYNTDSLNLRAGPNTESERLGSYTRGTWIETYDASGNWYSVKGPDGKTGYMSANFLSFGITGTEWVGYVKNPQSSQFTNLRSSASYGASVLGIYYDNTPMIILGENGGWYGVNIAGTLGYMRNEFVQTRTMAGSTDIATIVTPNNTGLNLREGPGKGYNSQRQFKGGRYVMVLNRGNGWWRVAIDGYIGYMSTDFLKNGMLNVAPPSGGGGGTGTTPPSSGGGSALVKNPGSQQLLNLREEPNSTARVLGQYKNGTQLTIHKQGSEWCYVTVDKVSKSGWMMTRYIDLLRLPAIPYLKVDHPQKTFVNLRRSPTMGESNVLVRIPHGAMVEVLIPGGDWAKVKYDGYTGYAVTSFLKNP